ADALPILRPHLTPQSSPTACTRRSRRTYAPPRKPPTPSPTLTWWSTRGLPNTERNPHDRHHTRTSRGADRHPPPRPVRPARAHLPRRPRPRGKPVVDRRPARFRYEQAHPPAPRPHFDFGTAAHKLVLGVGPELAVLDYPDWRTKAAREAAREARERGAIPLKRGDYEQIQAMAAALRAHP